MGTAYEDGELVTQMMGQMQPHQVSQRGEEEAEE